MNADKAGVLRELAGTWRLLSSEFRTDNDTAIYPLGEDAAGQCIFTESGFMSAQLMRRNRPKFASEDQAAGTVEELRAAIEGYVSYFGHFDVEPEQGKIITHVEGSMYPNWEGQQQERFFELTRDKLVLKTPPLVFGDTRFTGYLTWERR